MRRYLLSPMLNTTSSPTLSADGLALPRLVDDYGLSATSPGPKSRATILVVPLSANTSTTRSSFSVIAFANGSISSCGNIAGRCFF